MFDYYVDVVWAVNAVFAGLVALTAAAIFFCAWIKDLTWDLRRRRLFSIKANVYGMLLSNGRTPDKMPAFIAGVTPAEFIDIETNRAREAVFFNEAEQQFLKKSFISPKKIALLKKYARRSTNKWHRIESMLCLGYTKTESAIGILGKALYAKDEDISYFSGIALGQIKTAAAAKPLLEFVRKKETGSYKIASMLESFPAEITNEIIPLTDDKKPFVRRWAAMLLAKFAPSGYIKKLEAMTRDPEPEVRAAVCDCLGAAGNTDAKRILIRCLDDDNWLVRMHAITALEKVAGAEVVPLLIRLISDASWSVNSAVRDVMTAHVRASLRYIESFLFGSDEIANRYAVQALENSGYLEEILLKAASGKESPSDRKLIEGVVKSKFNAGLNAVIASFDPALRARAIAMIENIKQEAGI